MIWGAGVAVILAAELLAAVYRAQAPTSNDVQTAWFLSYPASAAFIWVPLEAASLLLAFLALAGRERARRWEILLIVLDALALLFVGYFLI